MAKPLEHYEDIALPGEEAGGSSGQAPHRPERLADFVGQSLIISNLAISIEAARGRREALDHVLLHGPPGLGKTSLARIISAEMGVGFRATSGPVIQKAGDLAAIVTNLNPHDVLFIDEIHRLQPAIVETLYPAMEDFQLDLIIGDGPGARTVRIDLPHFTLVGATTRTGLLPAPLRERFGIPLRLTLYSTIELTAVVQRTAGQIGLPMSLQAALEVASRSRGTPRIANRLLRRLRDFAQEAQIGRVDKEFADFALGRLAIDNLGLDLADRRYLKLLADYGRGNPVGLETIAAALNEDRRTLEDVIEPFMLQQGLIERTVRGRMLGQVGLLHLEQGGIYGGC